MDELQKKINENTPLITIYENLLTWINNNINQEKLALEHIILNYKFEIDVNKENCTNHISFIIDGSEYCIFESKRKVEMTNKLYSILKSFKEDDNNINIQ